MACVYIKEEDVQDLLCFHIHQWVQYMAVYLCGPVFPSLSTTWSLENWWLKLQHDAGHRICMLVMLPSSRAACLLKAVHTLEDRMNITIHVYILSMTVNCALDLNPSFIDRFSSPACCLAKILVHCLLQNRDLVALLEQSSHFRCLSNSFIRHYLL